MASQPYTAPVNLNVDDPHSASTVRGLGFSVLVCFLFMVFSRVFDMHLSSLHIPGISFRLMLVVIFVSGAFWRVFRHRIGKRFLWFTVWMMLGIPFSVWRGDSFTIFTGQWWASTVVFMAAGGLIADFKQYRIAAITLGVAIFVLSLFCLKYGTMETGRLSMSNRSRFANPNDMAQALLIGIPFWLAISKKSASPIIKAMASLAILVMGYVISKTGSRGAVISIGVLYLVMLHHASAIGKARLLLLGGLFLCAAVAFLPSSLKDRYKTLLSEDKPEVESANEDRLLNSAVTSTASREHLLRQSLILTATHPIFGVGAGQFAVAENSLAMAQGLHKGSWLGTHNTYMQVASETGVPGIFFFVSVLFLSLKSANSVYNATKNIHALRDVATFAEALFLALICLGITDLFIHSAYTMIMPVLAGMTISLVYTTQPLIAAAQRNKPSAPAPAAIVRQGFPAGFRLPAPARPV